MFSRILIFAFGVTSYAVFLLAFVQTVAFVSGIGLPWSIDSTGAGADLATAVGIDVALMLAFAVQHNVMARPAFKRRWTRIVPTAMERSVFVLLASLLLILLASQWRALPEVVWSVEAPWAVWTLYGLQAAGWVTALISTFLIDHFELFGVRQVWEHLRGAPVSRPRMHTPLFYRLVRHPLMLGFLVGMWSAPHMTLGHLLFSAVVGSWVLLSIRIEERDLVAEHGDGYREYRRRVPMLLPLPRRRPTGVV